MITDKDNLFDLLLIIILQGKYKKKKNIKYLKNYDFITSYIIL